MTNAPAVRPPTDTAVLGRVPGACAATLASSHGAREDAWVGPARIVAGFGVIA